MVEATTGSTGNWGKFLLARFDNEWAHVSSVSPFPSIGGEGWTDEHFFMLDLATGEGAIFLPGGIASYDLDKHGIWVCPLFEPTLKRLYKMDLSDGFAHVPAVIRLTFEEAPFSFAGYRRPANARAEQIEKLMVELIEASYDASAIDRRTTVRRIVADAERLIGRRRAAVPA